jgi:hypothetical protein
MEAWISPKFFFIAASSGFFGVCLWLEAGVVDAIVSAMMEKVRGKKNNGLKRPASHTTTQCFEKLRGQVIGSLLRLSNPANDMPGKSSPMVTGEH